MVSMGKPYPRYRSFNDAVSLTIFSAIDNTEFVKFITEVQDKMNIIEFCCIILILLVCMQISWADKNKRMYGLFWEMSHGVF